MADRTYRYFKGTPLYAFGHGLSYTQFEYGRLETDSASLGDDESITVSFELANAGTMGGEEVVQLYARHLESSVPSPLHSLAAFKRVFLKQGERKTIELDLNAQALRHWDVEREAYVIESGKIEIQVGASSSDIRQTIAIEIKQTKGCTP
jgi:beta-glucosidase